MPALPTDEARAFSPLGPAIKVLMVWPRIPPSFWSFEGMLELVPERVIQPPLGLITVAALCPVAWTIRLVDRSFEELTDTDLLWADLVMVSAMHVQREDAHAILARARALGRRTMIGGSYASTQPELLLPLADHVVVGEPDEAFDGIAQDLQRGSACRLYRITDKPDVSLTPVPRFDLLKLDAYASMAVQFSRGCPFQCEFCDIITIYGRRPRTKTAPQMLAELDALARLGWRKQVFIVDDNFIGNHRLALNLSRELEAWQRRNRYPFPFYTEASIDLADRPELIDAMVKANFFYVFIGIESPSPEALTEARKFQNLRRDPADCIRFIQRRGLWVTAGFIVGFDADAEDIFSRQTAFIEQAAIPWAMTGVLMAPPTTPLYERMRAQGRLIEDSGASSNFDAPNFVTVMSRAVLLRGMQRMLLDLYQPDRFYERAMRSLAYWKARHDQHPPRHPALYQIVVIIASMWKQGVRSSYRAAYWTFLFRLLTRYGRQRQKMWWGFIVLVSGQHFIRYAREAATALDAAVTAAPLPAAVNRPNRGAVGR